MLTVNNINEYYLKTFGMMIKIERLNKRYTLRHLAKLSGLSHTLINKIEHGNHTITEDVYNKLTLALHVSFHHDKEKNTFFYDILPHIHDAIFYADPKNVRKQMDIIFEDNDYYMHSICMVDYMILYIGEHTHVHILETQDATPYIHTLSQTISLGSKIQQQRFYLYRAMYHYITQNIKDMLEDLHTGQALHPETKLLGLYHYFFGRAESENFAISRANKHYLKAIEIFDTTNNIRRRMYAKLHYHVNQLKIYEYDDIEDALTSLYAFAVKDDLTYMKHRTILTRMLYYMLKNHYEAAVDTSDLIDIKTIEYYGLLLYAYYKLHDNKNFNKHLKKAKRLYNKNDRFFMYENIIDYIESIMTVSDANPNSIEKKLKSAYQSALNKRAFFEIEMLYGHYIDFLTTHRRYKDAYKLTQEMITIVEKTME
ncbi:MAG: helix-turn-helix domain-containing protein [Bacillota bacterium]